MLHVKVIILGATSMGECIARALSQKEYDVILVDSDQKHLTEIARELEISPLLLESHSPQFFLELAALKPDLLIAARDVDEMNLVSCALAKNSGILKTAALIQTSSYLNPSQIDLSRLFYVDHFLGEDVFLAHNLYKRLSHIDDLGFAHFAHGAVWMRTIKIPTSWKLKGKSLQELKWPETLVAGLIRRGNAVLFPRGSDCILPGDEVTLLGEAKIMGASLEELFNLPIKKAKSTLIAGGGESTLHLARLLLKQHVSVRIIEKNEERCRKLSELLPDAIILCEDSTDFDFLREEGIEQVDAFVANELDDAKNLLLGSIAVSLHCKKVIASTRKLELFPIFEKMGIHPVTSSRLEIINRILSILHQKTFLSIGSLSNDVAKIVELKIPSTSKWAGSSIAEISQHLPRESLVGVIENHGRVMIGKGDSILCPDDRVIALCSPHQLDQLRAVFGSSNVPLG